MVAVHTIDVALRATTGDFNREIMKSTGIASKEFNEMVKDINGTTPAISRLKASLANLEKAYAAGAVAEDKYKASKQFLTQEIRAQANGFDSLKAAQAEALAITRRNETAAERYAREVGDLNRLLKTGKLTQKAYNRELRRIAASSGVGEKRTGKLGQALSQTAVGARLATLALNPYTIALAAFAAGSYVAIKATKAFADKTYEQFANIDKIGKVSDKLGLATEELIGLRLAFSEGSGVDEATTDQALQRFTRRVAEASKGLGEAKGAIADLGLDAVELDAMGPQKSLEAVATKMAGIESASERLRIGFKLFDSEGAALVSTLKGGPEVLQESAEFARRYGIELKNAQVNAVEAANDAVGRVAAIWEGIWQQSAASFAPLVETIADDILDAADGLADWEYHFNVIALTATQVYGTVKDTVYLASGLSHLLSGNGAYGAELMAVGLTADSARVAMDAYAQNRLDALNATDLESRRQADIADAAEKAANAFQQRFADPSNSLGNELAKIWEVSGDIGGQTAQRAAEAAVKTFEGSLGGLDVFGDPASKLGQQMDEVRQAFHDGFLNKQEADRIAENLFDAFGQAANGFGDTIDERVELVEKAFDRMLDMAHLMDVDLQQLEDTRSRLLGEQAIAHLEMQEVKQPTDDKPESPTDPANVGLAVGGSVAAYQAELTNRESEARKQLDEAKRQNQNLERMLEKMDQQTAVIEDLELIETV